jgi:hypothetical protein
MTLLFSAATTRPGLFRVEALSEAWRSAAEPAPGRTGGSEPPHVDSGEANAIRWPWDARLVGFLASAAALAWGLLIAATVGLLDWLA